MRNAVLICMLVSAIGAASGQTRSEFEVAAVKQLDEALQPGTSDLSFVGTSGKPFRIEGHRVRVRGTLRTLIADAYDVKEYQVMNAPKWAETLMFEIMATTPGDMVPTQDQVRPMLQSLLGRPVSGEASSGRQRTACLSPAAG